MVDREEEDNVVEVWSTKMRLFCWQSGTLGRTPYYQALYG